MRKFLVEALLGFMIASTISVPFICGTYNKRLEKAYAEREAYIATAAELSDRVEDQDEYIADLEDKVALQGMTETDVEEYYADAVTTYLNFLYNVPDMNFDTYEFYQHNLRYMYADFHDIKVPEDAAIDPAEESAVVNYLYQVSSGQIECPPEDWEATGDE